MKMENQNDHRHHSIDIARPSNSIPAAETSSSSSSSSSSNGSKCKMVWIIFQIIVCVCQITVSTVILLWSKAHESPDYAERVRLLWVEGYICGCLLLLPLICLSYPIHGPIMNWLYVVVEVLKMAVGCFFALWFVFGSISISGSSSDAKKLDMLCQVLIRSGCLLYAIPSIGCFLLPRKISSALAPTNLAGTAAADTLKPLPTKTAIDFNALPTYRFKLQETGAGAVGGLTDGAEQERVISEEDAACCICLGKYAENDELRELPCCHFFHQECVDEWLKINARCPLCQSEISRIHGASTFANGSGENPSERTVGGGAPAEHGGRHGSTVS